MKTGFKPQPGVEHCCARCAFLRTALVATQHFTHIVLFNPYLYLTTYEVGQALRLLHRRGE